MYTDLLVSKDFFVLFFGDFSTNHHHPSYYTTTTTTCCRIISKEFISYIITFSSSKLASQSTIWWTLTSVDEISNVRMCVRDSLRSPKQNKKKLEIKIFISSSIAPWKFSCFFFWLMMETSRIMMMMMMTMRSKVYFSIVSIYQKGVVDKNKKVEPPPQTNRAS